ncbi:MAG TPA: hypothetical protein VJ816_11415 [Gemmatimonadales bacterium]|nr:hypothetical protein [Gemmatimonadales bacterium]
MTIHAGHCIACDALIWRTATHGRTGETQITYPLSNSVYARVQIKPGTVSPGIPYCLACAPKIGEVGPALPGAAGPTVIAGLDSAAVRYHQRYTDAWGAYFRAWLTDHMELPEHERDGLVAQWDKDRHG